MLTPPSASDASRLHETHTGTSAAGTWSRVVPLLRRGEIPTVAVDRAHAVAAGAVDAGARDPRYDARAGRSAGCVARYRRRAWSAGVWDLDDVRQEAYLAFIETIREWSGQPPFFGFFAIRYPRRLADGV